MAATLPFSLGYATALRVVQLGRDAFFGSCAADLPQGRSDQISQDDLLPQFGYVGELYAQTRVLLLGINPGNGPADVRLAGGEIMMPALMRFVSDPTPTSFLDAQRAYRSVCHNWALWRQCREIIGGDRLQLDEIAYSNCLPWRTGSESKFHRQVARKTAELYAYPLIDELRPLVIIAMGKKAAQVLSLGGRRFPELLTWNRNHASTPSVVQERKTTAQRVFQMLGRRY